MSSGQAKQVGHFQKRFYTPRAFGRDALGLLLHSPELLSALVAGRVSRSWAEKIMLTVTQVNDCRYCSFVHTLSARRAGVSELELARLVSGESEGFSQGFSEGEAVALAFAHHYARTAGRPEARALQELRMRYGPQVARDVLSYVRLIYFANLSGNAVDAFLSRLQGRPAPGSNPLSEFLLFVPLAPFTLPLLPLLHKGPDARPEASSSQ